MQPPSYFEIPENQQTLTFSNIDLTRQLFGEHNSNLQRIADATDISIHARGNTVFFQGDRIAASLAKNILKQLYGLLKEKYPIYPNDVDYAVRILSGDDRINLKDIFLDTVYVTAKKRPVIPNRQNVPLHGDGCFSAFKRAGKPYNSHPPGS